MHTISFLLCENRFESNSEYLFEDNYNLLCMQVNNKYREARGEMADDFHGEIQKVQIIIPNYVVYFLIKQKKENVTGVLIRKENIFLFFQIINFVGRIHSSPFCVILFEVEFFFFKLKFPYTPMYFIKEKIGVGKYIFHQCNIF